MSENKNQKYIMTLDEGTTSVRTIIVDGNGKVVASEQREFTQMFPQSGWVEHDAGEIWGTQLATIRACKSAANLKSSNIAALGITNQRETVVLWDSKTGLPVYNAIVWQDTRTKDYCQELVKQGKEEMIQSKTGLIVNPYFSATKIRWIIKNVPAAQRALERKTLLAGTIDSWLIWNLTGGKVHATDVSNASRTMLYNIHDMDWDDEILNLLETPKDILPEVKPSGSHFGDVNPNVFSLRAQGSVPITGVLGDQQAALFGQNAFEVGDVKVTYGTGCFILVNTGETPVVSKNKLLSTVAWQREGQNPVYALEGSVFIAGAAINWLRDSIRLIYDSRESDLLANMVKKDDNQKIVFVPALNGLGAPYWDTTARGAILGLERGTRREHIVKATLEAIAFQSDDLISTMRTDLGLAIKNIKVDGGLSHSDFMIQFQSSLVGAEISRPKNVETTALGAAFMAGLTAKFWNSIDEIKTLNPTEKTFHPQMDEMAVAEKKAVWKDAVSRVRGWVK